MIETKVIEIRDCGTFIPVLATLMSSQEEAERYLLARAGFHSSQDEERPLVFVVKLVGGNAYYDPHGWPSARTMPEAHTWIQENWCDIKTGDVVDVEFILGEKMSKKTSERFGPY